MKQLRVFGDSFAAAKDFLWKDVDLKPDMYKDGKGLVGKRRWDPDNPLDYKEHIASKMNCDLINDTPWTAIMGASDDFLIFQLDSVLQDLKEDDVVVFITTDPTREFLIPDLPNHGSVINFHAKVFRDQMLLKLPIEKRPRAEKQIQIAREYVDYIQSDPRKLATLATAFSARIAYIQKVLSKRIEHFIIAPGMSHFSGGFQKSGFTMYDVPEWDKRFPANEDFFTRGSIGHVGFYEFEDPEQYNLLLNSKFYRGVDKRRNHISKKNHEILANKFVDSMVNKNNLDLMTGFEKGFLNYKTCLDPEVIIDSYEDTVYNTNIKDIPEYDRV